MTEILQKLQRFENALVLNLLSLKRATVTKATHLKVGSYEKLPTLFNYREHAKELT